jgi:hypothetical protein
VTGKKLCDSHLEKGSSIGSWKIWTGLLNLGSLQAMEHVIAGYLRQVCGNEWVDMSALL